MWKKGETQNKGQGLVEYGLILVLVAIAIVAALAFLGPQVGDIFSQVMEPMGPNPEPGPGECYGSLLLPILVGTTGVGVGVSYLLPKRAKVRLGL